MDPFGFFWDFGLDIGFLIILLPIVLIFWTFYIIQLFLGYGTAFRLTRRGGNSGVALYGWLIVMTLAAMVPGLGIYLWRKYREI